MTPRARRRRAALLLALAVVAGALAAARVRAREADVDRRVGPLVEVVVARAELRPGARLGRDPARLLALRAVPAAFAPPDALSDPADAAGLEVGAAVPAGGYVTAGALGPAGGAQQPGAPLRAGERALELPVAGAAGVAPGMAADVLVTAETGAGAGRTYVALEAVEVLAVAPGGAPADGGAGADAPPDAATAVATLRVSAREAVRLTAARAFAREVRLLARPPGDRRAVGPATVASDDL